ncbi:Dihydrofolate reductase [Metarhizium album ARSEF 1941]|uniref:Dihydrofolate reductase n=1 Tax=Metarhizium album (strain ARSEF 1941) TaxID=1081103 RepID=A0A0B2WU22_METAS|nr:Dihydrofolate reductase [Metarhizium album ARSEF 1941]KHN99571.1 Dihydrofolate reductase [Metarhizium album ARSEF 1941]
MGGGRIDCYLDIASFFSYICIEDLRRNLDKLAAHGVEVDAAQPARSLTRLIRFHPVFLGGINKLSGNKPPWTLPAKAKYLSHDTQRAGARVGITKFQTPEDLFERGKTQSALRALLFIKANHPADKFLSAMHFLAQRFWTPPNADVVDESSLRALLAEATETPGGGAKLFTEADVDRIMDGRASMKNKLAEDTGRVAESGAFGCPWFLVTNSKGETQPVFGSDRFNHIYMHLGIPFQDVAILPPPSASKL